MNISDHFHAIPVSDGYHILFIDPETDVLCLGTDAPVGGPTKLLRKLWFEGPKGKGSPIAYAGGSNLNWGFKVAAAYGTGAEQSIWFFSVPSGCFHHNLPCLEFTKHDILKSFIKLCTDFVLQLIFSLLLWVLTLLIPAPERRSLYI